MTVSKELLGGLEGQSALTFGLGGGEWCKKRESPEL